MDYNLILTYATSHLPTGRDALVFLTGAALSNPGTCALLVFNAVVMIPGVGGWVARNPDSVKSWLDAFEKKVDELVDRRAGKQPPARPDAKS